MKTNLKLEIGLLLFTALLGIILQTQIRSKIQVLPVDIAELTGNFDIKTIEIAQFNELEIYTDFPVKYYIGEPKVIIKTDESLIQYIEISNDGEMLKLSQKNNIKRYSGELRNQSSISVYNNQPISYVEIGSNGSLDFLDTIVTNEIKFRSNGNASSRALINSNNCSIRSDGNSSINVKGSSETLDVKSNGNARFYLKQFLAAKANLRTSGNSGGEVYVTTEIEASAGGNSNIKLFGTPSIQKTNSNGNASIRTDFQ